MYYRIENNYPVVSPIKLDGFIEYTVGEETQELKDALALEELEKEKLSAETLKEETLARLTVKVASGKVFYADLASKVDIEVAIRNAKDKNITQTEWKLAEAINGYKYAIVTLEELEEASYLALQTKASLVGIGA